MKTKLTVEESQRLIELGVNPKMASNTTITDYDLDMVYYAPRFSVGDLINILPKEIEDSNLNIISTQVKNHKKVSGWIVTYVNNYNDLAFGDESVFQSPELIDALNKLAIWCLENNHIKTEKK